MNLGKKTTWDKIEVGEVFAIVLGLSECLLIAVKQCKNTFMYIQDSEADYLDFTGKIRWGKMYSGVHKLPLSVQRLWKCEK